MDYSGEKFTDVDVLLCGNNYRGCTFRGCRLIFDGTDAFGFAHNTVIESPFFLADAAATTLRFLEWLYKSGLTTLVENIFKNIREGTTPDAGDIQSDSVN